MIQITYTRLGSDQHSGVLDQWSSREVVGAGDHATVYSSTQQAVTRVSKLTTMESLHVDGYFRTLLLRPEEHPLLPHVYSVVVFISDIGVHYEVKMERLERFNPIKHRESMRRVLATTTMSLVYDNLLAGCGRVGTRLAWMFRQVSHYGHDVNETNIMVRTGAAGDTIVLTDLVGNKV